MTLMNAQIVPSEEDSQTFTVISTCGEVYKLKASDAKERQVWVNRLRWTVQNWDKLRTNSNESLTLPALPVVAPAGLKEHLTSSMGSGQQKSHHHSSSHSHHKKNHSPFDSNLLQSLETVAQQIQIAEKSHLTLVESINDLRSNDSNLLQIKALSSAALLSLQDSLDILKLIQ